MTEETPQQRHERWRHMPERARTDNLVIEVPDHSVPDSITYAEDPEREFLVRWGAAPHA